MPKNRRTNRVAILPGRGALDLSTISAYLPDNYFAVTYRIHGGDSGIAIIGRDACGWTLEDYVIPRLASGLHFARVAGEFSLSDYPSYQLDDQADVGLIVNDILR